VSSVIDLSARRKQPVSVQVVEHPSGVILPASSNLLSGIASPEVRAAICSGDYGMDIAALLPHVLREGDRVLVAGDGVALVSTLIAKSGLVSDLIAAEADAALFPYLKSVHELNGVTWVEAVNAFPAVAARGRVPYFVRRDSRKSSLRLEDGGWLRVSMVPLIDLELIVAEAQISVIIWCCAADSAGALAEADLGSVRHLLFHGWNRDAFSSGETKAIAQMQQKGFVRTDFDQAILMERPG